LLKLVRSWYATDAGRLDAIVLLIQIPYLLIAVVSTTLAWRKQTVHRQATIAVWSLVAYFWVMTTLVLSISRYMVPAAALLTLLSPALIPVRSEVAFQGSRVTSDDEPPGLIPP
jgi:hypothetical protein